jgi:hypothetical protein
MGPSKERGHPAVANPKSQIVNPQSKDHSLFEHGEHFLA